MDISLILIATIYGFIGFMIGYRCAKRKIEKRRPKLRLIQGGKKSIETKFPF